MIIKIKTSLFSEGNTYNYIYEGCSESSENCFIGHVVVGLA